MAKAVYRKYAGIETPRYQMTNTWIPMNEYKEFNFIKKETEGDIWRCVEGLYTGYHFSESEGFIPVDESVSNAQSLFPAYFTNRWNFPSKAMVVRVFNFKDGTLSQQNFHGYATGRATFRITERMEATVTYRYSRGAYLSDVLLDYGSVPDSGRAEDGYWYEFVKLAPAISVQIEGAFRGAEGFVNKDGLWKPQSEIKANIAGTFK